MKLEVKGVRKTFGKVIALEGADMCIESGDVRGLVGGNGSGKSTLSKILSGSLEPDEGVITIDGEPYSVSSPIEAKNKGIVMTSQEGSLLMNLSVAENLCLCNLDSKAGFVDRKKMKERAIEVLTMMGKEHLLNADVAKLPANEQYLIEFAKGLMQDPKILILDEITSALYKNDVELVKRVVNELTAQGKIIIFISHRLNEVFDICQSVTVLRNGEYIGTFPTKELSENELISHMSGRQVEDIVHAEINKDYKKLEVLFKADKIRLEEFGTEIKFQMRKGEFVGIAGLDGQGQTAFLKELFGLGVPYDCELDGKPLHISSPLKAIKNDIAYLTGDREAEGTFKERSIEENLHIVKKLSQGRKTGDADEILKKSGVRYNKKKDLITSLSGGNQQKVVIARWTSTEPKLLLADDPTKGIDIQARRDAHSTFKKNIENGSGVIMISSDDEELVDISKIMPLARILVFYEGQIIASLRGGDITVENIAAHSSGMTDTGAAAAAEAAVAAVAAEEEEVNA